MENKIMPELPEVETVRNTLKTLIVGKEIRDIDVYYEKMIRNREVDEFKKALDTLNNTDGLIIDLRDN
jgi:formamidopyrimidine-DNA glycosylase